MISYAHGDDSRLMAQLAPAAQFIYSANAQMTHFMNWQERREKLVCIHEAGTIVWMDVSRCCVTIGAFRAVDWI